MDLHKLQYMMGIHMDFTQHQGIRDHNTEQTLL